MTQYLSHTTTQTLLDLLKEKKIEWVPETEYRWLQPDPDSIIQKILIPHDDEFPYRQEDGVIYRIDEESIEEAGNISDTFPALNDHHLLELIHLVFGGRESGGDAQAKKAYSKVEELIWSEPPDIKDKVLVDMLCKTIRELVELHPRTQAIVLIRRYFESGKALSNLEWCFLDLISEIKQLN
jgi:hypothetical protein